MNILDHTKSFINSQLFSKYCQSQNYYFTRDIHEILNYARTKSTVRFKDWNCYDEQDEYLKRVYHLSEYPTKLQLLSEYYKFHHNIIRYFQEPISTILNKYQDKKRKIEYYRIAKIIDQENKNNPHQPPKYIIGEKPSPLNSQQTQPEYIQDMDESNIKNIQILKDISCLQQLQQQPTRIKLDISQTLNDICKQIGNYPDQSSFFIHINNKNEEIKLNHFLNFMNQQSKQLIQQKQFTLPNQPQEKLINSIIKQKQPNQLKSTDIQYFLKPQHIDYHSSQTTFDQKFSKTNLYTEENITKIDSKLSESLKNKSKLIIKKGSIKSISPSVQFNFNQNNTQQILKTQQSQIKLINNNQISKLLIENQIMEQDIQYKVGAQTHRPINGNSNHFNYSPQNQKLKLDNCKTYKTKTQHQPSQFHNLKQHQSINRNKEMFRKKTSQNIHIHQESNQERIITLQNDQPKSLIQNTIIKDIKPFQSFKHRKQISENRALFQKNQGQDHISSTDRRSNLELLIKNNRIDNNNLIKTKTVHQGSFQNNILNNQQEQDIQLLIKKVAKQNQQVYLNNYKNQKNYS